MLHGRDLAGRRPHRGPADQTDGGLHRRGVLSVGRWFIGRRQACRDLVPRAAEHGGDPGRTAAGLKSMPGLAGGAAVTPLEGHEPADKQPPFGVGAFSTDVREAIEGRVRFPPRRQIEGLADEGRFSLEIRRKSQAKVGIEHCLVFRPLMRRGDRGDVEQRGLGRWARLPSFRIVKSAFAPAGEFRLATFLSGFFPRAHPGDLQEPAW